VALPLAWQHWVWPTGQQTALMILIGLFSIGGQFCNITGYRLGETSFVAPVDYLRLLPAGVIGYLLFNESPGWHTLAGAILIVGASLYTTWRELRSGRNTDREADSPGRADVHPRDRD